MTKKHNVQQMWKHLNHIFNTRRNNSHQISIDKFLIIGKTVTNDTETANSLNDHFINIGYNLACAIDTGSNSFKDYLYDNISNSFFINPTTYSEIDKELSTFKNKKASNDNFKIDLLKSFKQFLIPGLVIFFNLSFNEGVVPDLCENCKSY